MASVEVVNNDPKILTIQMTFFNDDIHDSVYNLTFEMGTVIDKMVLVGQFNIPEDRNDKNYQKEYYKSKVDLEKVFNGLQGGFLIRFVFENFYKCIDFEPKLPFKPVSLLSLQSP